MNNEEIIKYTAPLGIRIMIYILGPLFIIGSCAFLPLPFYTDVPLWFLSITIPVSISMGGLFSIALWDCLFGGLYISADKVKMISSIQRRELAIHEIKGYSTSQNYINLIPINDKKKKIKISTTINKSEQFYEWLNSSFIDLDKIKAQEHLDHLLETNKGIEAQTINERKLKTTKICIKGFNWFSGILMAICYIYPFPYHLVISFIISIPVISILLKLIFGKFVRIDERKQQITPTLFFPLFFPGLVLLIRMMLDTNVFINQNFWVISSLGFLFFCGAVLLIYDELNFKKGITYSVIAMLLMCGFPYSVGTTIYVNQYFDDSESHYFKTTVLEKEEDHDKVTTYTFVVEPWGPKADTNRIDINKSLYEMTEIGDTVDVGLKQGFLAIPWYGAMK